MPVFTRKGSILDCKDATILVCPVSRNGNMFYGLAKQFREKFGEEYYKSYREAVMAGYRHYPLIVNSYYHHESKTLIMNVATRENWTTIARQSDLIRIMNDIVKSVEARTGNDVCAIPMLCCGDYDLTPDKVDTYIVPNRSPKEVIVDAVSRRINTQTYLIYEESMDRLETKADLIKVLESASV